MKLIHGFLLGTALLILAYLSFKNPNGVVQVLGAGSKAYNSGVSTLQGS